MGSQSILEAVYVVASSLPLLTPLRPITEHQTIYGLSDDENFMTSESTKYSKIKEPQSIFGRLFSLVKSKTSKRNQSNNPPSDSKVLSTSTFYNDIDQVSTAEAAAKIKNRPRLPTPSSTPKSSRSSETTTTHNDYGFHQTIDGHRGRPSIISSKAPSNRFGNIDDDDYFYDEVERIEIPYKKPSFADDRSSVIYETIVPTQGKPMIISDSPRSSQIDSDIYQTMQSEPRRSAASPRISSGDYEAVEIQNGKLVISKNNNANKTMKQLSPEELDTLYAKIDHSKKKPKPATFSNTSNNSSPTISEAEVYENLFRKGEPLPKKGDETTTITPSVLPLLKKKPVPTPRAVQKVEKSAPWTSGSSSVHPPIIGRRKKISLGSGSTRDSVAELGQRVNVKRLAGQFEQLRSD